MRLHSKVVLKFLSWRKCALSSGEPLGCSPSPSLSSLIYSPRSRCGFPFHEITGSTHLFQHRWDSGSLTQKPPRIAANVLIRQNKWLHDDTWQGCFFWFFFFNAVKTVSAQTILGIFIYSVISCGTLLTGKRMAREGKCKRKKRISQGDCWFCFGACACVCDVFVGTVGQWVTGLISRKHLVPNYFLALLISPGDLYSFMHVPTVENEQRARENTFRCRLYISLSIHHCHPRSFQVLICCAVSNNDWWRCSFCLLLFLWNSEIKDYNEGLRILMLLCNPLQEWSCL